MKKSILIFSLIFFALQLSAQEPQVKFYLKDGTFKSFNINDIEKVEMIKSTDNMRMLIYYQKTLSYNYLTSNIDSLKIISNQTDSKLLVFLTKSTSTIFELSSIDSIVYVQTIDEYESITISKLGWMKKNLDVAHYQNGDPIPEVKDSVTWATLKTGAWCYYNNDPALGAIYGKLYNWYAVNDPRGLAPNSYHIPSTTEWATLNGTLFGYSQVDSLAGGRIKERGYKHWVSPNKGATNETDFCALPGGGREGGIFFALGYAARWWTTTEDNLESHIWIAHSTNSLLLEFFYSKKNAISVRCVRNDNSKAPIISSVNPSSAKVGEYITISGIGFGALQKTSRVLFDEIKVSEYSSWSDSSITVKVPDGVSSSKLYVIVNGYQSKGVNFVLNNSDNYYPITFGTKVWMGKNLDIDHYQNGDAIEYVPDPQQWINLKTGAWCYMYNDPKIGEVYGKLYNRYAVIDPRGLAPKGWHVAKYEEWESLAVFFGGRSVAGAKLKESGFSHWSEPNSGNNESGFTALPGGYRFTNGSYQENRKGAYWWNSSNNYYFKMDCNFSRVESFNNYPDFMGFSVRCVRNPSQNPAPIIINVKPDSAFWGDMISIHGKNFGLVQDASIVSFNDTIAKNYSFWSDTLIIVKVPVNSKSGPLCLFIDGQKSNKVDFRTLLSVIDVKPAFGQVDAKIMIKGSGFGNKRDSSFVSFNGVRAEYYYNWSDIGIEVKVPSGASSGKLSITVNGKISNDFDFIVKPSQYFESVTIGTQVWMKKNLDVDHYLNGDSIPQIIDSALWVNSKSGAWCYYNNDPSLGAIYGKLYNWYAVNDQRGLAPSGWHVPSDTEWQTLELFLGTNVGGKLKQTGTSLWEFPNEGANNTTLFSAIPSGINDYYAFRSIGRYCFFWTSTDVLSNYNLAVCRWLSYNQANIFSNSNGKSYGYSVRCIKD